MDNFKYFHSPNTENVFLRQISSQKERNLSKCLSHSKDANQGWEGDLKCTNFLKSLKVVKRVPVKSVEEEKISGIFKNPVNLSRILWIIANLKDS